MNSLLRHLATALLITTGSTAGALAAETAPQLAAGGTFTLTFPDMPPTFYAMCQKKNDKAQLVVYLPTNYHPGRKFPLFLFLGGGDGGVVGSPGVSVSLVERKDFVVVGVPLFKAAQPDTPEWNYIMNEADGRTMWPLLKTMLAKLEQVVPNIDPACQVIGGSSNGAHATAALVDGSDGEVARRFSAFLIVEGGGKLKHYDLLKGKAYLMVSSNAKSKPRAQQICDAAKAAGARTTFICEDVGKHDFPVAAYPAVREWLRGQLPTDFAAAPAAVKADLKVGDKAPAFKLMASDGKEYSLEQFAGKSAVALCWYLRAGSGGSRVELSGIQAEMGKLAKYQVQVLGITVSELGENAAFAKDLALTFPLLSDPQLTVANAYGTLRATAGPTGPVAERWVILIDAQGIVRSVEKGEDVQSKGRLLVTALEEAKIPVK